MPAKTLITFANVAEAQAHIAAHSDRFIALYEDAVLDITDFLPEHPGGSDVLLEFKGKDMKLAFEDVGHSGFAHDQMMSFKIGVIGSTGTNQAELDEIMRRGQKGKWISDWVPTIGALLAAAAVFVLVSRRRAGK